MTDEYRVIKWEILWQNTTFVLFVLLENITFAEEVSIPDENILTYTDGWKKRKTKTEKIYEKDERNDKTSSEIMPYLKKIPTTLEAETLMHAGRSLSSLDIATWKWAPMYPGC